MNKPSYTHVAVQMWGGGWNLITAEEYGRLPEQDREELERASRVSFINDGEIVEEP